MADYEAINGVASGSVEAVNGVAKSSIEAINGLSTPSEEYSGVKCVEFGATDNDGVLSFDPKYAGSTPSASGPIYTALEYDNAFSVSFWLKTTQSVSSLGGRWDASGYQGVFFEVFYGLPRARMGVDGSNYHLVRSASTINDGAWRNLVFTYSGSGGYAGWKIYVDGSAVALTNWSTGGSGSPNYTLSSSVKVTDECFTLGNLNLASTSPGEYDGKMSNVSIWDAELGSSEVTELYNSGSLLNLNTHSQAANLISWWKLGDDASDLLGSTVPGSNTANLIVDCSTAAGFARSDGTAYERTDASGEVDVVVDTP